MYPNKGNEQVLSKPHAICQLFKIKWEDRFGESYFIIKGRDHKFANELVDVPMDEITRRLDIFLSDPWYIENAKCSLPSFVKNFNVFVPRSKPKIRLSVPQFHPCSDCGKTRPASGDCPNENCPTNTWKLSKQANELLNKWYGTPITASPNEQFRCPKCQKIHSPQYLCENT